MTAIVISIIALALTVVGLIVKLSVYMTKIDVYVDEMRKERASVRTIPIIEYRLTTVEKHLGIHTSSHHVNSEGHRNEV